MDDAPRLEFEVSVCDSIVVSCFISVDVPWTAYWLSDQSKEQLEEYKYRAKSGHSSRPRSTF